MILTHVGYGQSAAGEAHLAGWHRDHRGAKRGVLLCGGAGMTHLGWAPFGVTYPQPRALLEAGYPVLAGGTAAAWGSDTARTRAAEEIALLQALTGSPADKVILWGQSMGFLKAIAYARANPTKVACIVGTVPAVDPQDIHDNNRGGFAAAIETAYGGAGGYAAAMPSHNPFANQSEIAALGIPMRLYYSTDDTITLSSKITAFAAGVGAQAVSLGAKAHSPVTVPADDVLSFLAPFA